eukprot:CAMPEP_0181453132 /NCGR_PEP_ID=MMETSP1110-20121109/29568_1 /TAXON_ID=174948 /ORGANISM="Symbiodinium sp., Strain CCMP421" /LENGTH=72 /DNA_ID=CAMNT_0023577443 /DNA_START=250 /DNA_END=469 /DNA_ORIENTATION=+
MPAQKHLQLCHHEDSTYHEEIRGAHAGGGRKHHAQAAKIEIYRRSPSIARGGGDSPGAWCDQEDAPRKQHCG